MKNFFALLLMTCAILPAFGDEITTDYVHIGNPPSWLTESRVTRVVEKIQNKLESDKWKKRVEVYFYTDAESFKRAHGSGDWIEAYSRTDDNGSAIHLGPQIDSSRFDGTFGHELVHVMLHQKYKTAIPGWLEEGLANHLADKGTVDYGWLAHQPFQDVKTLVHAFNHVADPHYHYQASQAVAEMVEAKCDLHDLLQMAVGKSFETYLANICEITDVNAAFREWVLKKAPKVAAKPTATAPKKATKKQ